jgi:hypothetical protein
MSKPYPLLVWSQYARATTPASLLYRQSEGRRSMSGEPPFPDAAACNDSLVPARTDHYGVDL